MISYRHRLLITPGDHDGIGLEVLIKALLKAPRWPGGSYVLFRSPKVPEFLARGHAQLLKRYSAASVANLGEAQSLSNPLIEVISSEGPPHWVESAARHCLENPASCALVTGPLSKEICRHHGFTGIGHTDILSEVSGKKALYMGFLGKHFNVVLLTGHMPLQAVPQNISFDQLKSAIDTTNAFFKVLRPNSHKPIGVLGLNPHSGENGLIGDEETKTISRAISIAKSAGLKVIGPLVPDTAFLKKNWGLYASYLALYHDQGLIPFKTVHGQDSGVHITLGLPFVRTSVDHGTAKDIFGKNIANPGSMIDALHWAKTLLKRRKN